MSNRTLLLGVVASVAALAAGATALASDAAAPGRPPASTFSARVDNPWFPLLPGTRYVYVGVKDGQPSRDVLTVTHQTQKIDGVVCVVVQDRLYLRGRLFERTTDWYTQDALGNVWYFGENTAELGKKGNVTSTEGSWMAGVNSARPGIYMPARPRIGQSFQQEFSKGQAEDHFRVIGLIGTVTAPAGTKNTLLTEEWTPLEPGTLDHKMYVRGIGTVLEQTVKGGNERAELVSVTRGV
jgi:hypothetical protein